MHCLFYINISRRIEIFNWIEYSRSSKDYTVIAWIIAAIVVLVKYRLHFFFVTLNEIKEKVTSCSFAGRTIHVLLARPLIHLGDQLPAIVVSASETLRRFYPSTHVDLFYHQMLPVSTDHRCHSLLRPRCSRPQTLRYSRTCRHFPSASGHNLVT